MIIEAYVVTECVADVDPFCSCPICLSDLSAYDAVRILPRYTVFNTVFNRTIAIDGPLEWFPATKSFIFFRPLSEM